MTVPKDAVVTREGKSVVFEIEDNKVRSLAVVTGADLHGQIIVKQGLAGSETLVSNPPQKSERRGYGQSKELSRRKRRGNRNW